MNPPTAALCWFRVLPAFRFLCRLCLPIRELLQAVIRLYLQVYRIQHQEE